MTRMANGHDVREGKGGREGEGSKWPPLRGRVVQPFSDTPAVASNNQCIPRLIIFLFIFSNSPSINRLSLTRYTSPPFSKLSSLASTLCTAIFSARAFFARGSLFSLYLIGPARGVRPNLCIPL